MIRRDNRSILAGVGMITLAVIVTSMLLAAFLNNRCQINFGMRWRFIPAQRSSWRISLFGAAARRTAQRRCARNGRGMVHQSASRLHA